MKEILIYVAVFILAAAASVPTVYGNPMTDASKVPQIVGFVQFPQTKSRIVRHTFRLQIPKESRPLSQHRKILLGFPKPVAPGTELKIAMIDVKITGIPYIWLYPVSAKLIGLDTDIPTDIPIGMVRLISYHH